MKTIPMYQVDAFADQLFSGNPAAVCPLEKWLPDNVMQNIALENNLSETAFVRPTDVGFHIRWFTPVTEVDLCGHATLATAHVLFNHLDYPKKQIVFESLSGMLRVENDNDLLVLDFPADVFLPIALPEFIRNGINILPLEVYQGKTDYLLIYDNEGEIEEMKPNMSALAAGKSRGVIVSAPGNKTDFVSRFFAPGAGIDEDPVTGSAHTTLTPYWAKKLGKNILNARQISSRGGNLRCKLKDNRVKIAGKAITFFKGEIYLQKK